jgi:hypothetical protein
MGQATSPNSHLATGSEEESSFCEIRRISSLWEMQEIHTINKK